VISLANRSSLLQYIFHQAIETAKEKPVILFFDEAEQILGRSVTDEHTMKQQAAIKDFWNGIMQINREIYIFAATNHPRKIELADFNRRLPHRWHVKPPGLQGRINVLRYTMGFQQPLTEEDLTTLAERLDGFTVDDIQNIVKAAQMKARRALRTTSRWTETNMDGATLLMLHEGSEVIVRELLRRDMDNQDQERCISRPVTLETLI